MTRNIFALSFGFVALLLLNLQVVAQPSSHGLGRNCAPRSVVLEKLENRFGETRQSIGLAGEQAVMEMFASPERGTWTLTVTLPSGITCVLLAGTDWEALTSAQPEGAPV